LPKSTGHKDRWQPCGPTEKDAHTFVAIGAAEAGVTEAGEVAAGLADTASPGATHVGRDVTKATLARGVIGRHDNGAAVNY
jgi:hypothetical protein